MSFDWTKIAGYHEDMTAEEKLALLDTQEEENQPPAEPEPEKKAPTHPEPEQQQNLLNLALPYQQGTVR